MPLTPAQIKDKLINALDDEKNVIDERAVEEVIGLLETSVITKEILEQTRLGRDINLVRKNSKNPNISKRAKNLVRAWQKLIDDPGSPRPISNGQHPSSLSSSPALPRSIVSSRLSPAVTGAAKPVQATSSAGRPLPIHPRLRHPHPVSPATARNNSRPSSAAATTSQAEDSNLSWPASSPSNQSESSQDRLLGDRENQDSKGSKNCASVGNNKRNFRFDSKPLDHSSVASSKLGGNRASDQKDVSKTNVANRKRTRSNLDDSKDLTSAEKPPSKHKCLVSPSQSLSASHKNDVINGSVLKKSGMNLKPLVTSDCPSPNAAVSSPLSRTISSSSDLPDDSLSHQKLQLHMLRQESVDSRASSKTGKVKTTEQIIEEMQKKSAGTVGVNVMAQIRTTLTQKEEAQQTPEPARKGKRGRKRKGVVNDQPETLDLPDPSRSSDNSRLAQAKSEYIERFLQTSVAPTPGEESFEDQHQHDPHPSPLGIAACDSAFDAGFTAYPSRQDKPDSGPSASPPDVRDEVEGSSLEHLSEAQLLARLPPLHPDGIDWTLHDYPAPLSPLVDAAAVEQLHTGNVDCLNGTYDRAGQFKRWHEMMTVDSIYDEPLHILPYVLPND